MLTFPFIEFVLINIIYSAAFEYNYIKHCFSPDLHNTDFGVHLLSHLKSVD